MSVVILVNSRSGRGRGEAAARAIAAAIGRSARIVPGRPGTADADAGPIAEALADAAACVVVGGDGTLHGVLPPLIAHGTPVYHAAMGTENLFSREFRMSPDPDSVAAAVRARRTLPVDVGSILRPGPGIPSYFALMCSFGPDAGVTRRLAAARRGRITHASYLLPVLHELADPSLPRVSAMVDGRTVVHDRRGWLLVCNSHQYGFRANPGVRASMTDGLLDVVFFPAESGLEALHWILASRARRHLASPEVKYATGARVRVECDGAAAQADGDYLADSPDLHSVELACVPRALNVLLPA